MAYSSLGSRDRPHDIFFSASGLVSKSKDPAGLLKQIMLDVIFNALAQAYIGSSSDDQSLLSIMSYFLFDKLMLLLPADKNVRVKMVEDIHLASYESELTDSLERQLNQVLLPDLKRLLPVLLQLHEGFYTEAKQQGLQYIDGSHKCGRKNLAEFMVMNEGVLQKPYANAELRAAGAIVMNDAAKALPVNVVQTGEALLAMTRLQLIKDLRQQNMYYARKIRSLYRRLKAPAISGPELEEKSLGDIRSALKWRSAEKSYGCGELLFGGARGRLYEKSVAIESALNLITLAPVDVKGAVAMLQGVKGHLADKQSMLSSHRFFKCSSSQGQRFVEGSLAMLDATEESYEKLSPPLSAPLLTCV